MLRGLFRLPGSNPRSSFASRWVYSERSVSPSSIFLVLGRLFGLRAGRVPPDAPRVMSVDCRF